ncbi:MAG: DUF559 domain-containing protein [Candidatus Nitrosopolaris sp.]
MNNRNNKRPESTKYERLLASALDSFAKHIDYKMNPEVRLSSCTWYTPDFIIGNRLIVEVDGGIHDLDYRRTPDRIRHRALENMGYNVYRVRNKQVENSPFDVAGMIVDRYYQIMEIESQGEGKDREKIPAPKIKKIYNPSRPEPLPEDLERLIPAWTIALHSKLTFENWTAHYFKQILSIYDSRLVTNQCAMERMILYLLGLNILGRQDAGKNHVGNMIDFEYFYRLFDRAMAIVSELFEDQVVAIYLKNSFNITAPNFIKNLVFNGGPRAKPGIISIKDADTLESNIDSFNQNFSKVGIAVAKRDVVIECREELEKLKRRKEYDRISSYRWLSEWLNLDSKSTDIDATTN